jgi:hypothetical protein
LGRDEPDNEGQEHLYSYVELTLNISQFVYAGHEENISQDIYYDQPDDCVIYMLFNYLIKFSIWLFAITHAIHKAHVNSV